MKAMIEGLVPDTSFVQVPPSPVAELVTHLAAFFDLAEVKMVAGGGARITGSAPRGGRR